MKSLEDNTFVKLFLEHQLMLRRQLNPFLTALHPLVKEDVVRALEAPGKLLSFTDSTSSASPSGAWSLLPLLIFQHFVSDTDKLDGYNVALAIECFICALDLLDDIEDEDQTSIVKEIGPARVLNISTALLGLTNHIVLSLVDVGFSPESIVRLLNSVQKSLIIATAGQHRDILAEHRLAESFTIEECIEIAEGKAGVLMSLACHIGVLCANGSEEMVLQFSELGKLLGIAYQLDNDSHDLYDILQNKQVSGLIDNTKTDLIRQKKTLPVVLAAHAMSAFQISSFVTDEEKQKVLTNVLYEGITTTWGISLLYRERAREQLRQIEVQRPISPALQFLLGFV